MTTTYSDAALTSAWVDLTVANASLISSDVTLQNVGIGPVAVVFGGGDPTALGKSGVILGPREKIAGNQSNIWCRALDASGSVSATTGASGGSVILVGQTGAPVDVGGTAASQGNTTSLSVRAHEFVWDGTQFDRRTKPNLVSRLLSAAATTNATSVKNAAGDLFRIRGYNAKASAIFLKLYNKASAPTVGTDTPVATYRLEASGPFEVRFDPLYFSTGIAYAITGAAADADTTALVAADVVALNVEYA